jgi:hypothetical protein
VMKRVSVELEISLSQSCSSKKRLLSAISSGDRFF